MPTLASLNKKHQIEMLICDGGSSDLTCSYVQQWQLNHSSIQLLHCELGRAKQMNAGAQVAKYDCLIFLHADTLLPKHWPELIEGKAWGRFNVRLSGQSFMFRVIETLMNWRSCITQVATGDQAIFVQKSLFLKVAGYPSLPLMEDIALSKILRQHSPISCIKTPLVTSSRRWENKGIFKTIGLMWQLRWAYFLGVSPTQLAKKYYPNYGVKRLDAVVHVFSKLPILGYVKTRLIPQIGAQSATEIHRYLLKKTLTVVDLSGIPNELWVAQEKHHSLEHDDEFLQYETQNQQGSDLGDRMAYAIKQGFSTYKKVILIGTDCLELTSKHLKQSQRALDNVDVVLTPAEDGGFISIACRVFDEKIFDAVAWGTETALEDVLNNIKALSLQYTLLKPVRDIDTFDDVSNYPELLKLIH